MVLLALDRDTRNLGGRFGQARLLGTWTPRLLPIHRERTQHVAVRRNDRSRPTCLQTTTLRQVAIIGPERIGKHVGRSEEHTSELQSRRDLVCRLLLEKKK